MFKIVLGLIRFKQGEKRLLNDYNELKKTEDKKMAKAMSQYVTYKKGFMNNMKFDPFSSGFSKYVKNPIVHLIFPRLHHKHPLASDPDLL